MTLYDDLLRTELPDRPISSANREVLPAGAAPALRRAEIGQHRLRREIVATWIANSLVNRGLDVFVSELEDETGAGLEDITLAYVIARDAFGLLQSGRAIEELPPRVRASARSRCSRQALRVVSRRPLVPGPRQAAVADGRGGHPLSARHRPDHGCGLPVASGTGPAAEALAPRDGGMHRCRRAARRSPGRWQRSAACSLGVRHRGGGRERGGDGGCRGSPDAGGPCPLLPGRAARPRLARRCHRQGAAAQRLGPAGTDPARGRAGRCLRGLTRAAVQAGGDGTRPGIEAWARASLRGLDRYRAVLAELKRALRSTSPCSASPSAPWASSCADGEQARNMVTAPLWSLQQQDKDATDRRPRLPLLLGIAIYGASM